MQDFGINHSRDSKGFKKSLGNAVHGLRGVHAVYVFGCLGSRLGGSLGTVLGDLGF